MYTILRPFPPPPQRATKLAPPLACQHRCLPSTALINAVVSDMPTPNITVLCVRVCVFGANNPSVFTVKFTSLKYFTVSCATMQLYVDSNTWGLYLGMTKSVTLAQLDQNILTALNMNMPTSISSTSAIMVVGAVGSSGAKIVVQWPATAFAPAGSFSINFCPNGDSDCVDAHKKCVGIGRLSVCVNFGEFACPGCSG